MLLYLTTNMAAVTSREFSLLGVKKTFCFIEGTARRGSGLYKRQLNNYIAYIFDSILETFT